MQKVVFNAHYFAYCDDAVDVWVRSTLGGPFEEFNFDFMLKKSEITWFRGARFTEELVLHVGVTRWGVTSFDVAINGFIGSDVSFNAIMVYVSTIPGNPVAVPIPPAIRAKLEPYSL